MRKNQLVKYVANDSEDYYLRAFGFERECAKLSLNGFISFFYVSEFVAINVFNNASKIGKEPSSIIKRKLRI